MFRSAFRAGAIVVALAVSGCSGTETFHQGETQSGLASWYGAEQDGGRTASGEIYDMNSLTAAHRHLPFGSIVRVTNRENGRFVDVRINDRGPFGDGDRIIDVSAAAAAALDMKRAGLVEVTVEVLRLPGQRN
jgi:rare lipoprotein A